MPEEREEGWYYRGTSNRIVEDSQAVTPAPDELALLQRKARALDWALEHCWIQVASFGSDSELETLEAIEAAMREGGDA
jgi:hypothetical protein